MRPCLKRDVQLGEVKKKRRGVVRHRLPLQYGGFQIGNGAVAITQASTPPSPHFRLVARMLVEIYFDDGQAACFLGMTMRGRRTNIYEGTS